VESKVIIEVKSVEKVTQPQKAIADLPPPHRMKLGYLLNFAEALMKDGITRTINGEL